MITRLLALGAALVMTAQALAFSETRMVCKYTGKVVTPCPCPPRDGTEAFERISRASCCEIQKSERFSTPAVLTAAPAHPERLLLALPVETWVSSELGPVEIEWLPHRGQDPPPRSRLYVSLRHILI